MRTFNRFLSAVLLFFVIISVSEVVYSQSPRMKDRFYLGAFIIFADT